MAGGAGCSGGCCRVWGGCLALQRQRPWTQSRGSGGALPPKGVSSSLLPHWAAFIPALGVGFVGFLWSPWIRLCHRSSLLSSSLCSVSVSLLFFPSFPLLFVQSVFFALHYSRFSRKDVINAKWFCYFVTVTSSFIAHSDFTQPIQFIYECMHSASSPCIVGKNS